MVNAGVTRKNKTNVFQCSAAAFERVKRYVFNQHLNTGSDGDDETKGCKLFQARVSQLTVADRPDVLCLVRGMPNGDVFPDRSRRRV